LYSIRTQIHVYSKTTPKYMCNTWYIFLVDTYKDIMYARNQLYLDRKVSLVVAPFVCLRVRVPLHHVLFISCSLQLPLDVQSLMAKHQLVTYVVTEGQASFALDSSINRPIALASRGTHNLRKDALSNS
jgi:hypothetical protein